MQKQIKRKASAQRSKGKDTTELKKQKKNIQTKLPPNKRQF